MNALRYLLIPTAIALLAACASPQRQSGPLPVPPRPSDDALYRKPTLSLLPPAHSTWQVGGQDVDVTLLVPSDRGPFPLVIYLPGLGESSGAGSAWRRIWAEAGYAVLSVQSAATGTRVWSNERARAFDFRAIALEHFSAAAVPQRLAFVQGVIDEAIRRQRAGGDAPESRIDATRIAVAGFDVGAMTAMAVAGQRTSDAPLPPLPAASAIRSVVALSPYADFSGMGTEARFRDVRLPVLSVTSPEDTDAYGLVTTAAVRRAPYQYMPAGRKYLLVLAAAPHSLMGGQEQPGEEERSGQGPVRKAQPASGSERTGTRDRMSRSGSGGSMLESTLVARPDLSGAWATQLRNVQTVSTAYLDATLKDDARAADWLARDAQRWLGGSANLQSK